MMHLPKVIFPVNGDLAISTLQSGTGIHTLTRSSLQLTSLSPVVACGLYSMWAPLSQRGESVP